MTSEPLRNSLHVVPTMLDEVITLIERLGACVALGVGGAAILRFADYVFPLLPILAVFFGLFVALSSVSLALWAADNEIAILWSHNKDWRSLFAAAFIFIVSLFFLIGGLHAGLKAILSSA